MNEHQSGNASYNLRLQAMRGAVLSRSGQSLPALWRIFHDNTHLILRFSEVNKSEGRSPTVRVVMDAERDAAPIQVH